MKIKVNGREEALPGRCSVREYLVRKGARPETVAVELNLNVIEKARYAETYLAEGDVLEVVKFVGGG